MKVRYFDRALRGIDELLGYVAGDNPRVAREMAAAIEAAVARCAERPRVGVPTSRRGIHRYPIRRYRLALVYRVRPR